MLPTEVELIHYIQNVRLANYTQIARKFGLRNHIIPDLLEPLEKNGKIRIKKIGANKIVEVVYESE